jgi:CubicO group peptidase (beta-lactamase class C family)
MAMPFHPEYADIFESRINPFIKQSMRKNRITGLSMALVDENGILSAEGYGWADRRGRQSATPRTVYKIGSITKLFTGTAAMQLHEKGMLDIDRPVVEYLPEFSIQCRPGDLSRITARTLMTHHSGLPADCCRDYWSDDPHAFRKVLEYLKEFHLTFPPNTAFSYSNLATALMGVLIERISRLSYPEYIERNILRPLGMKDSASTAGGACTALLSKAYAYGHEAEDPSFRDAPAGAIFSNALDMARFISMVLANGSYQGASILQSRTLAEMLRPQNAGVKLDLEFRIGLNWLLSRPALSHAGRTCWHDGGSPHFFSILVALPDAKLGAVVLSHSDGGMVNVGLIADEILKHAVTVKTGKSAPASDAHVAPSRIGENGQGQPPTGTFASSGGIVSIFQRNGSPRVVMQGKQFLMIPAGDGWYSLRFLLFGLIPMKIAAVGALRLSVRLIDGRKILGIEQFGFQAAFGMEYSSIPIPAGWSEHVGEYRLVTGGKLPPFSSVRLAMDGGILLLQAKVRKMGNISLVVNPISEVEGVILGFGRTGGGTIELTRRNGVKILRMAGLEFVKSQFCSAARQQMVMERKG